MSIAALCVVTAIRGAHKQGDNAALGQRHPHRHPASVGSPPCNQGRKVDERLCGILHRRTLHGAEHSSTLECVMAWARVVEDTWSQSIHPCSRESTKVQIVIGT
jgi:hypothetical protein